MAAFATVADLAGDPDSGQVGWLTAAQLELISGDEDRLLQRATEVVAEAAIAGYLTDDDQGAPTVDWQAAALRDATCAQVEQWLEVGEENDVAGYTRATSLTAGGLNLSALPSVLAPRARRILRSAGLAAARAY